MQVNDTRGFVAEPEGRGTIGILWSCLATFIICFWSSVHADFDDGEHLELISRIVVAISHPEYLVQTSVEEYLQARSDARRINGLPQVVQSQAKWTIMHAFYVNLGALVLEDGKSITMVENISLVRLGCISPEPPLLKEVKDKSKKSRFAKFLALLQIIWFALQVLARAIRHMPISLLELNTTSYVVLTFTAYVFYWQKPVNVRIPTITPLLPTCKSTIEQIRTFLRQFKDDSQKPTNESASNNGSDHPTSEPKVELNDTLVPSDYTSDNVVGVLGSDTIPTELAGARDLESQQPPSPGVSTSPSTVPQGLGGTLTSDDALEAAASHTNFLASDGRRNRFVSGTAFLLAGLVFSALHCLAWNFYFPSAAERWLWRTAPVLVAAISLLFTFLGYIDADVGQDVVEWILIVGSLVKLILLVVAFVALRRMRVGVYETVHWANFLPHI